VKRDFSFTRERERGHGGGKTEGEDSPGGTVPEEDNGSEGSKIKNRCTNVPEKSEGIPGLKRSVSSGSGRKERLEKRRSRYPRIERLQLRTRKPGKS